MGGRKGGERWCLYVTHFIVILFKAVKADICTTLRTHWHNFLHFMFKAAFTRAFYRGFGTGSARAEMFTHVALGSKMKACWPSSVSLWVTVFGPVPTQAKCRLIASARFCG